MVYEKDKVEVGGEEITIKKGALKSSLKVPQSYTFKKPELVKLKKVEVGKDFTFKGNKMRMTELRKKRITLAITLMSRNKK